MDKNGKLQFQIEQSYYVSCWNSTGSSKILLYPKDMNYKPRENCYIIQKHMLVENIKIRA